MNQCKLTKLKLHIHHAKLLNKKSKTPSKHVAHLLSIKQKYPEIISQILATLFRLQVFSGCSALGRNLIGERWKSLTTSGYRFNKALWRDDNGLQLLHNHININYKCTVYDYVFILCVCKPWIYTTNLKQTIPNLFRLDYDPHMIPLWPHDMWPF